MTDLNIDKVETKQHASKFILYNIDNMRISLFKGDYYKLDKYFASMMSKKPYLNSNEKIELLKVFKSLFQRSPDSITLFLMTVLLGNVGIHESYDEVLFEVLTWFKELPPETLFHTNSSIGAATFLHDFRNPFQIFPFLNTTQIEYMKEDMNKNKSKCLITLGQLVSTILEIWDEEIYDYDIEDAILSEISEPNFDFRVFPADIYFDKDKFMEAISKFYARISNPSSINNMKEKVSTPHNPYYDFFENMATYIMLACTEANYIKKFVIGINELNKRNSGISSQMYLNDKMIDYNQMVSLNDFDFYTCSSRIHNFCESMALLYKSNFANKSYETIKEFFSYVLRTYYTNTSFMLHELRRDIYYPSQILSAEHIIKIINIYAANLDCPISDKYITDLICDLDTRYDSLKNKPEEAVKAVSEGLTFRILDIPSYDSVAAVMEAYDKNSSKLQKAQAKGYYAFKKFQSNASKVDSQLDKISVAMKNLVMGNKRQEIIEGKSYTPWSLVKKLLGGYAVFCVAPMALIFGLLVKYTLGKKCTNRERRKILSEMEVEIEMLDEKIDDAKAADDRKAKYEMMRTRAELKKAMVQIKSGLGVASDKDMATTARSVGIRLTDH